MLFFFTISKATAQSGIFINWNNEVGCQIYDVKERDFVSTIGSDLCTKVCAKSTVTYTLSGNNGIPINATWSVNGGSIAASTGNTCTIQWGDVGTNGLITFSMVTYNNLSITKTLCIEKIAVPIAAFIVYPYNSKTTTYTVCHNQLVNFTNLTTPVNQYGQDSFLWDFGDGTFSSEVNPSHSYSQTGSHDVILIVTNACGCQSRFVRVVHVLENAEAIPISCPTVVCEGQTETYSLPFDGAQVCHTYDWAVYAGPPFINPENNETITPISPNPITINEHTGDATVTWQTVDASGFGYLTFYPNDSCEIKCLQPTTIKVPVIQTNGTIIGDTTLCLNQQTIYKLPQWPTTDFQWEVIGNTNNSIAIVLPTDQRNEVAITPLQYGTFTLRATYQNTLLNCGGTATLRFTVAPPVAIEGPDFLCQGANGYFATVTGIATPWVLTNSSGTVIRQISSSASFSYTFTNAGTYTLTAAANATCPDLQHIIKVFPVPVPPVVMVEVANPSTGNVANVAATNFTICLCKECNFNQLEIHSIHVVDDPFCHSDVALAITSNDNVTVSFSQLDNILAVTPSSFVVPANVATVIPLTLIPYSTTWTNPISLVITAVNDRGEKCTRTILLTVPPCYDSPVWQASKIAPHQATLVLAPNPAQEQVTLTYSHVEADSTLALYDLLGRKMGQYPVATAAGSMTLSTSGYPAGVYIVVVSGPLGIQMQQKLIINTK